MEKVATYCQAKLAEQNYHMQLGAVYWYSDKQQACSQVLHTTDHRCRHTVPACVRLTDAHGCDLVREEQTIFSLHCCNVSCAMYEAMTVIRACMIAQFARTDCTPLLSPVGPEVTSHR